MSQRVLGLLDQFERMVDGALHLGWINKVVLDEKQTHEFFRAIREALPGEIHAARQVLENKEKILSGAREEADSRRQRLEDMLQAEPQSSKARERVNRILQEAHAEAALIRHEADDYAHSVLHKLFGQLSRMGNEIRNGMEHLAGERGAQDGLRREEAS